MAFIFVSNIKPFKSMWNIKVKTIRLWKQYSGACGETIEMVLVDLKASFEFLWFWQRFHSIYFLYWFLLWFFHAGWQNPCYCEKNDVDQFDPKLKQGVSKISIFCSQSLTWIIPNNISSLQDCLSLHHLCEDCEDLPNNVRFPARQLPGHSEW